MFDNLKLKLNRAKTSIITKYNADPEGFAKRIIAPLTIAGALLGFGVKINDARVSRSKAKTWDREVARRERKDANN